MSFFDDLRNLDRNNVGGWPKSIKTFFAVLIFALILLGGLVVQDPRPAGRSRDAAAAKRNSPEEGVRRPSRPRSSTCRRYRKQLEDMKEMLRTMLRQLPSKTEMPDLLVDISQTALAAGIVVDLFQPGGEVIKEFYAEKPIQLKMLGTYHQFGTFISGVASLPRVVILTMHDVSLQPVKAGPARAHRLAQRAVSSRWKAPSRPTATSTTTKPPAAQAARIRRSVAPAKKPARAAAKKGANDA